MQKIICLQAGHEGVTSGATGAPGEREGNIRIRNRLSEILIVKGFQLFLSDANPPQNDINQDFNLFLSLHMDADIYGTGGGVIGYIDPAIDSSPESNAESKRIKEAIESEYFTRSGIINHPERNNRNITRYYMWAQLSAKTPCVLLEMGVVQDAHDKVILADTERVATAIARGICKAFGVAYDAPSNPMPPAGDTVTIPKTEYESYKAQIKTLISANQQLVNKMALLEGECKTKLSAQKKDLVKKVIDLASTM